MATNKNRRKFTFFLSNPQPPPLLFCNNLFKIITLNITKLSFYCAPAFYAGVK